MKRALVTGGTGFIGRHTLPELVARGFDVHVAGRSKPSADFPAGVTFHECDLLDTGAVEPSDGAARANASPSSWLVCHARSLLDVVGEPALGGREPEPRISRLPKPAARVP